MHRFFVPLENLGPDHIQVTGDDARHMLRVLRLASGDRFIAVTPDGSEYLAELYLMAEGRAAGRIVSRRRASGEPPVRVTLVQALAKGDKMDLVIQKATELGVSLIVPVVTERCVVRLDGERVHSRRERWQRIAQSAAAQCARALVPLVTEVRHWKEAIQVPGLALLAWEGEQAQGLKDVLAGGPTPAELAVFVGPEGGYAPHEVEEALSAGLCPVSLGPRILRTETAALALLTAIMYQLGDFGRPPRG
ncbi:MAG: 16S rRNA (uracil(1498)-N(3))-methyltransferase [Bacillota bacterium]